MGAGDGSGGGRYSGKKCRLVSMFSLTVVFFFVEIIVGEFVESFQMFTLRYSGGHHDLYQCKPSISTSNVALNANPGTVLKTACPEDFKTPNIFKLIEF